MESLRERYDAYCEARERTAYREHAGLGAAPGPTLEEEFEDLESGDALEDLARERASAKPAEAEGLARLATAIEQAWVDAASRREARELVRLERDGADRERRSRAREALFVVRGGAFARRGHATGLARARARLPGVDFEHWIAEAERFLEATDVIHAELCAQMFPHLGIDPDRGRAEDAVWVDHLGAQFDALFPPGRLTACAAPLLEGLSIDLDGLRGLRLDDEPRPERASGVACFGLRCPGDVVISSGAPGGASAYAGGFHAIGRALACAFTSGALPVERRRPHDRALARGHGWLLSDRFADPAWLADFPSGRHAEALLRGFHLRELFARRRAAARGLVAWELAQLPCGADPGRLADRFVALAERATGLAQAAPDYLESQDADLGALDELRGRCLASHLAAHLRERFGWRFWRERKAGDLLKELWNTGSSYTVEQLAGELGLGSLTLDPWIDAAARGV